eukprot:gene28939-37963_t
MFLLNKSEHRELYLDLSEFQIVKLRQLTIILRYDDLFEALQIPPLNTRELEDLIIDTIYTGLLSARLNQKSRSLHIFDFFSRDVRPENLPFIIDTFVKWHMKEQREYGAAQRQEAQALADAEKHNLKNSLEAGFDPQDIAKLDSVSAFSRGFSSNSALGKSPRSKVVGSAAQFYGFLGKI